MLLAPCMLTGNGLVFESERVCFSNLMRALSLNIPVSFLIQTDKLPSFLQSSNKKEV